MRRKFSNWIAVVAPGALLANLVPGACAHDFGVTQPGAVGKVHWDPGLTQPGTAGHVGAPGVHRVRD